MPNGRDARIVNKFTPNHFLLTPEAQPQTDIKKYPNWTPDKLMNPRFSETPPKGLVESLDEGLRYILPQRKESVEEKFGKGSVDWILNNLTTFTAEERYRLHDMFFQMKPNKINATPVPHDGEQIRTTSPIIGRQG